MFSYKNKMPLYGKPISLVFAVSDFTKLSIIKKILERFRSSPQYISFSSSMYSNINSIILFHNHVGLNKKNID